MPILSQVLRIPLNGTPPAIASRVTQALLANRGVWPPLVGSSEEGLFVRNALTTMRHPDYVPGALLAAAQGQVLGDRVKALAILSGVQAYLNSIPRSVSRGGVATSSFPPSAVPVSGFGSYFND